jgi:hypothetical protein
MFAVARLTKRIVLFSLIVMIASEAVSAMTRELSTMSCNEAVMFGACVVERLVANLIATPDSDYSLIQCGADCSMRMNSPANYDSCSRWLVTARAARTVRCDAIVSLRGKLKA